MSDLKEDIKRLREYRKASEADNCDCGCFQDDAIANVCDALENLDKTHTALVHKYTEIKEQLEASQKDITELTRKGEELCCAYGNSLIEIHDLKAKLEASLAENRDLRVKLSAQTVLADHAQVFQDLAMKEEIEKLTEKLEASLKENAALSENLAISNTAAVELEARLEKCVTTLKSIVRGFEEHPSTLRPATGNEYRVKVATALLKELGKDE